MDKQITGVGSELAPCQAQQEEHHELAVLWGRDRLEPARMPRLEVRTKKKEEREQLEQVVKAGSTRSERGRCGGVARCDTISQALPRDMGPASG